MILSFHDFDSVQKKEKEKMFEEEAEHKNSKRFSSSIRHTFKRLFVIFHSPLHDVSSLRCFDPSHEFSSSKVSNCSVIA